LNATNKDYVEFNMRHFIGILPLLLSLALMVGCASDFQSTNSTSSPAYDSSPDTSIQDSIDRMNQQMAADAANAAAQQQFLAGMAAAQETMNNANNNQATSNW
jgi:predicted lipid-binding transport protein (Tim44 family)